MGEIRPKTIFCDIDGTLVKQNTASENTQPDQLLTLLPGTAKKLEEWDRNGYNVILTTGRKESMRYSTEKQLRKAGIYYDQLIMGIGGGKRYLINNRKKHKDENYALAINLDFDGGVNDIIL